MSTWMLSGEVSLTASDVDDNSSDACGIALLDLYDDYFTCSDLGTNTYTLEVTDNNNNSSTCSGTITVIDDIPPTIYCFDNTVLINSDAYYTLLEKDVYDAAGSFDNCSITSVSFPATTYGCSDIGEVYAIDVTVTDQSGNTSTCTATVSVDLDTSLPDEWSSSDIGTNTITNTYTFDPCTAPDPADGEYTITGSGNNAMGSTADNIAFASQSLCGDGSIIAKVESVTSNGYGGLMIRETTDAGAKQAAIFSNLSSILRHEVRYTTNGVKQVNSFYKPTPIWLKLERQGDWVFTYYSSTGASFQYVHGVYLPMQNCVEIGLASFTYWPNTTAEAVFSHVSVTGSNGSLSAGNEEPDMTYTNQHPNPYSYPLFLFPNPANEYFNLRFEHTPESEMTLNLYSMQGQLLQQQIVQANTTNLKWEVAHLGAGSYYLVVEQNGARIQALPLVITR